MRGSPTRLLFFARPCFRSLPPIGSLEQARKDDDPRSVTWTSDCRLTILLSLAAGFKNRSDTATEPTDDGAG